MQIIQEGDTRTHTPLIPLHPFMPYTDVFNLSQYTYINPPVRTPPVRTPPVSMPRWYMQNELGTELETGLETKPGPLRDKKLPW